jgi:hypothetical protein
VGRQAGGRGRPWTSAGVRAGRQSRWLSGSGIPAERRGGHVAAWAAVVTTDSQLLQLEVVWGEVSWWALALCPCVPVSLWVSVWVAVVGADRTVASQGHTD